MEKTSVAAALPSVRSAGLARLFTPSIPDVLFVAIIAWCFLSGPQGWMSLLMDGDTGFHIRVGDWILDHQALPTSHPFSFSVPGREWFAFEWLSQVALSLVHAEFGLKGVTLGAGLLIGAVFALLARYSLWKGANPFIAVITTLVAVNIARIHFWARPHLFTWVFLVAAIWILERERQRPSRWIWAVIPLMMLWANLHGGFVLFFVLLTLAVAGIAAEAWFSHREWRTVRRFAVVGIAAAGASLVNPYGIRLLAHVFEIVSAGWLTTAVEEFKSPQFRTEPLMTFMALMFLSLALCGRLVAKRRYVEVLWIVFLAYSSLVAVRQAPIFALVAAPIVAAELSELWTGVVRLAKPASVVRILDDVSESLRPAAARGSVLPLAFVGFLVFAPDLSWPTDFPKDLFPTAIVNRHASELAASRVFTTDQWSDYLIYRNYPKQRDYIDGQHQYYGERHVKDYVATVQADPSWKAVLDRFRFDYVLCPEKTPLVSVLRMDPHWRQIDSADGNLMFAAVNR